MYNEFVTDAASCAIVRFLEIESTEELSNGWMLLSAINLLSMGADSLIDCMTVASLPSTLVKCLYLFFDLPDVHNADMLMPGCEFTPRESRVLLQKVFVQVCQMTVSSFLFLFHFLEINWQNNMNVYIYILVLRVVSYAS